MCAKSFVVSTSSCCKANILLVLSLSVGLAVTEESILISHNDALPPSESVEARIKLRQHREASALNRFTFSGNVLDNIGDVVEHWFVMFCPGWHEKCQSLLPSYELLGVQWEDKLNTALMSSKVRFAKVDCATEKALCVSLGIDDYPSVLHYREQQQVNAWFGGAPGLVRWVKEELQPPKRRASTKTRPVASGNAKLETALEQTIDQAIKQPTEQDTCIDASAAAGANGKGQLLQFPVRTLLSILIFASAAVASYFIYKYIATGLRKQDSSTNIEDVASKRSNAQKQARVATSGAQSITL